MTLEPLGNSTKNGIDPVRSVLGNIDIQRPPSVNANHPWSSLDLNVVQDSNHLGGIVGGDVSVQASNTTPPVGGRIKGLIAGQQSSTITAQSIGEGEGGGGSPGSQVLQIGGEVGTLEFQEFPAEAKLDAFHLKNGSIRVIGKLDGEMRFNRIGQWCISGTSDVTFPYCATPPDGVTSIVVEARNLSTPNGPRETSSGKIIVTRDDSNAERFPTGTTSGGSAPPPLDGIWAGGECRIEGDFTGLIYAWDFQVQFNIPGPKITIGRSMADPQMQGSLRHVGPPNAHSGEIRSFRGNHVTSTTAVAASNIVSFAEITVNGDTEAYTLIEFGAQMGHGTSITVGRDALGDIQALYFYGSTDGGGIEARITIGRDLYGQVRSVNATPDEPTSCFADSGRITVMGNVYGSISHTGHVKDFHTTDIRGNLLGSYGQAPAHSAFRKKYAGHLTVGGSVGGMVEIFSPLGTMRGVSAARIQIGEKVTGTVRLLGSNDGECSLPENVPVSCHVNLVDENGTHEENCPLPNPPELLPTGFVPGLTSGSCCTICDCQATFWTDFVQPHGSIGSGWLSIGGALTGSVVLGGDVGTAGSIVVDRIEGGTIGPNGGESVGIRAGGQLTVSQGFTSGAIHLTGAVEGWLKTADLGPPPQGSAAPSIVIDGALTAAAHLDVKGEMRDARIELGSVAAAVRIGTDATQWHVSPEGVVNVGEIIVNGTAERPIEFRGCLLEENASALQSICPEDVEISQGFCVLPQLLSVVCNPP